MTAEFSNKFRNMSLVAAIMVVIIHVVFKIPLDSSTSVNWFLRMTKEGCCRIAVPFFFAAAGYFLSNHVHESGWWIAALKKRIGTLLIPYLIFNVYAWCFGFFVSAMNHTVDAYVSRGFAYHILHVFGIELLTPAYGIMWFVRALYVLVVLSPLIVLTVRNRLLGSAFSVVLLICCCVARHFVCANKPLWMFFLYVLSLDGLFFFSLGIFARVHNCSFIFSRKKATLLVVLGFVCFWAMHKYEVFELQMPGIIVMLCGVWSLCPFSHWPDWLTRTSFPIYLLHMIVLTYIDYLLKCLNASDWVCRNILNYSIVTVIVCGVCIFIANIIMGIAPRCARILFGGRT